MGDSFTHEFSMSGVDTGRRTPDQTTQVPQYDLYGQPLQSTQTVVNPGQPIMRPSFLQSFLANLGPALSAGTQFHPTNASGGGYYGGIGAALGGIQQRQDVNREWVLQAQAAQRAQAESLAKIAEMGAQTRASEAATAREKILTPGEFELQQINLQRMKGISDLISKPGGLDTMLSPLYSSLGQRNPNEQAQIDAAKGAIQAGVLGGKGLDFSPMTQAVDAIAKERGIAGREALSPEKQALQAYLNNPMIDKGVKKDAATFVAWKAKQSPQAVVMANMLPPSALDQQAELYSQTHELPSGLTRSPGTTAAIIARAAELHPDQNLAANQATFKASQDSLKKLQTNLDQVSAFEGTALKNLDQVALAGAKIPDLSARFANVPVRAISSQMVGTPEMARFKTALLTAQTESAKLLNSANAQGVLSDQARKEAEQVLDGNLPFPAMMASINQLKTDFANRHQSYQMQINDIQKRLGGAPSTTAEPQPTHRYNPQTKQIEAIPSGR